MRLVVAIALIAGCYRPAAEDTCKVLCPAGECPGGAQCMAGRCVPNGGSCPDIVPLDDGLPIDVPGLGDAFVSPDAMIDGPATTACTPAIASLEGTYRVGQSFTMNRAKSRAAMRAFDAGTGMWKIAVADSANVDMAPPTFMDQIAPAGLIAALDYPRLTPDGNTIFMTAKDSGDMSFPVFSNRDPLNGRWSAPQPLHLQDQNGLPKTASFGLVLGTPTEASPRRMPISFDTANLREYEEVAQDTWRERTLTTAATLGVTLIREPSFSPDGLRLVFVGQTAGGQVGIYTSKRAANGGTWNTAVALFDDGASAEGSPYLAADCSVLFYDNSNAAVVNRAR